MKYLKKDGDPLRRSFGLPDILQPKGTKSPSIQCEHLLLNDSKEIQFPPICSYKKLNLNLRNQNYLDKSIYDTKTIYGMNPCT